MQCETQVEGDRRDTEVRGSTLDLDPGHTQSPHTAHPGYIPAPALESDDTPRTQNWPRHGPRRKEKKKIIFNFSKVCLTVGSRQGGGRGPWVYSDSKLEVAGRLTFSFTFTLFDHTLTDLVTPGA